MNKLSNPSQQQPNILLVDDLRQNLLAMEKVLKSLNVNIVTATSGEEALAHTLDYEFAVILLDVQMPGMDGFETATILRENDITATTPIVFVTAISKEKTNIFKGYESGAVDYLFKPIEPEILKSKVQTFIELYNERHDKLKGVLTELKQAKTELETLNEELELRVKERTKLLKKTEEHLLEACSQADRANAAKSEFLSNMSHEIRTPLNTISGYAQLLEFDETLDNEQRKNAKRIRSAGQHLLSLVNDVLDLSKIEAGHVHISIEPVSLMEIAKECLSLSEPLAQKFDIKLDFDEILKSNVCVQSDYFRLKQILLNLVSNAIKYNKSGGSVEILIKQHDGRTAIGVKDTGIGITEEQQKQIFEPFNRLGQERGKIEGTGIGLVIAKNLIKKMNGTITIETQKRKGSTFWVELDSSDHKMKKSDLKQKAKPKKQESSDQPTTPLRPAEHIRDELILLVEDNPSNQGVLLRQLKYLGYKADVAVDGDEGYQCWSKKDYALILMDCNMPKVDGYEATQHIRETEKHKNQHTPIIAFTANAYKEDITKCMQCGMDDFLVKPVELTLLRDKLDKWLGPDDTPEAPLKNKKPKIKPKKDKPPVDLAIIKQYIGDDPEAQKEILDEFIDFCPSATEDLNKAFEARIADDVKFHAHKMKSSAKSIGAMDLASYCLSLETAGREEDWEEINMLVPEVIKHSEEVIQYLKKNNFDDR